MKKINIVSFLCTCLLVMNLSACQQDFRQSAPSEEWITPTESIDMNGMNLFWQHDNLQFAVDVNAKLSVYVNAEQNEDGNFAFDDGQDWLLLLETALGNYPLLPRRYIQLGGVSCTVFNDYSENDTVSHILVTVEQTAGYQIYDCVFDSNKEAFKVIPVYEAKDINFITTSKNYYSASGDNPSDPEEIKINVNYASDKIPSDYNFFAEDYVDYEAEKIMFNTNTMVKDFKFIEIGCDTANSNFQYFESAVLYSLDELLPEKPLVVTWLEQGRIPHRGISYTDENHTTRYFYISASGENGSLLLTEFKYEP